MGKRTGYAMVEENDPHFRRFWDAYPKRVSKKEARKAWMKLRPTAELVDRMVGALEWQVPLHQWDARKYQYAPYPASWLNDHRWEDEPPVKPVSTAPKALQGIEQWMLKRAAGD